MIKDNLIIELKNKISSLEKKDIDLIIADFDDTIFCRKEQLEDNELLRNNRWKKWTEIMKNVIWIENIANMYYKNKKYPTVISDKLRKNHDLILTAWDFELQTIRVKTCNLSHINTTVVADAEEKILETILYIINTLKFIPNKITVYEDRPKYFIENRELLEEVIWTEIEIMLVEMIDNYNDPIIKKV